MALTHDPFVPTPDSAGWEGDRFARDPAYFADMVSYMDKVVGRILQTLEDLGVRDETLVLFTGDNGTSPQIASRMSDGTTITVTRAGRPTAGPACRSSPRGRGRSSGDGSRTRWSTSPISSPPSPTPPGPRFPPTAPSTASA